MKNILRWPWAIALCAALLGCQSQESPQNRTQDDVLAIVQGEPLTQKDFDDTQAWLPPFARQLDSNANVEISRFWSLIQIMRMAQDARERGLMTPAERQIAIKEALAQAHLNALQPPDRVVQDDEIRAYQHEHPDVFFEPPAFTVNYALVKNEQRISVLAWAHAFARGAQLGYNPVDLPKERNETLNRDGNFIRAHQFDYIFTTVMREDTERPAQLGPFVASDGLIFSCPQTIAILETAPIGKPIRQNLACSGDWKAFVILKWRRDKAPMDPEKARQVAIQKILEQRRIAYQKAPIEQKLGETPHP